MIEKILIIKLGALGDIIMAMDAMHAIRQHHPDAEITLLTRAPFVGFAQKMPWLDHVLADPSPKLLEVAKWLGLGKTLRDGRFNRVYDLQCNDRTSFYFRLLGEKSGEWCGSARGCSHPRPYDRKDPVPTAERLLRFLEFIGVERAGSADTSWLTGSLQAFVLPEKFVVFVPGCSPQHPAKRWPAAHFAELAHLLEKQGIASVAVGTAVDSLAIEEIRASAPCVIDLAGKTDLGQLAALMRMSMGVIGNDTGPIHIAAVTAAPTLVLMSSKTDPERMMPHGPDVSWLRREKLSDLAPGDVLEAIRLRDR